MTNRLHPITSSIVTLLMVASYVSSEAPTMTVHPARPGRGCARTRSCSSLRVWVTTTGCVLACPTTAAGMIGTAGASALEPRTVPEPSTTWTTYSGALAPDVVGGTVRSPVEIARCVGRLNRKLRIDGAQQRGREHGDEQPGSERKDHRRSDREEESEPEADRHDLVRFF